MPILKKWQLEDFKKNTSVIQPKENLNPLLAYIKLTKDGYLYKTDFAMFCRMKMIFDLKQGDLYQQLETDSFKNDILIHEKTLFGVINTTDKDSIEITEMPDKIVITAGEMKVHHKKEDINLFPRMPDIPDTFIAVGSSVLRAIGISKSFVGADATTASMQGIHINEGIVFGISRYASYFKEIKDEIPNMILLKQHANILSQFDAISFEEVGNFMFFKVGTDELIYAFVKAEIISPSIRVHLDKLKEVISNGVNKFEFNKSDLLSFCEFIEQTSRNEINICVIEGDSISLLDTNEFNGANRKITVDGNIDKFKFNSSLVIQGLKALPQKRVNCSIINQGLLITDKEDSYAYFMGFGDIPNG
jgi:hypothetical protein